MRLTAKGMILLVLGVVVFALTFAAATIPVKRAEASSVAATKGVTGGLTNSAVTFVSQSSLVLPPEAVDWVLSNRGYGANTSQGSEAHK